MAYNDADNSDYIFVDEEKKLGANPGKGFDNSEASVKKVSSVISGRDSGSS